MWKKDKDQVCDEKNDCKIIKFKKSLLKSAEISSKIKGVDKKKKVVPTFMKIMIILHQPKYLTMQHENDITSLAKEVKMLKV